MGMGPLGGVAVHGPLRLLQTPHVHLPLHGLISSFLGFPKPIFRFKYLVNRHFSSISPGKSCNSPPEASSVGFRGRLLPYCV